MVIDQLTDGGQIIVRCPSYDNFSLCKITKRKALLQAFTHPNYLIDFAFSVYYFCSSNDNEDDDENYFVAYQMQNKRFQWHRNFAVETV